MLCATGYNLHWLRCAIVRLGLAVAFFVLACLRRLTATATLAQI
jgi:hypothetical protein